VEAELRDAKTLQVELLTFKAKITSTGHDSLRGEAVLGARYQEALGHQRCG
jgi:hypothetical protein